VEHPKGDRHRCRKGLICDYTAQDEKYKDGRHVGACMHLITRKRLILLQVSSSRLFYRRCAIKNVITGFAFESTTYD
jgi:hypothetical protein